MYYEQAKIVNGMFQTENFSLNWTVMNMGKSFFIIGGYFANLLEAQLSKYLKEVGNAYVFLSEGESAEHYIKNMADKLKKQLSLCDPDYLVLEFQALLQLFCNEDQQLTDRALINMAFDEFISVIKAYFPEKRVFVIQTNVPKFYIMAEDLIKKVRSGSIKEKAAKILNKYERYVQKEVGGFLINTTSYYFYKKKRGYLLNDRTYEDECYFDISMKISNYVKKEKKISKNPNPGCAIDRYVNYAGKTIQWNALSVFLNRDKIVDHLILSAPTEFVKIHKKELLAARKIKAADLEEWRKIIAEVFEDNQEFRNILIAFYATNLGVFQDENISYRDLFKNGIISREVLRFIQKYVRDTQIADANQVNPHNAGYYYALMIGKSTDEALQEGYVEDNATIAPVLVDAFGSCVSRTCLRERYSGNTSLAGNKYWFQVPAFVESQKKLNMIAVFLKG